MASSIRNHKAGQAARELSDATGPSLTGADLAEAKKGEGADFAETDVHRVNA